MTKLLASQKRKLFVLVVVRWPVGGIRTFLRYVYGKFPFDKFKLIFLYPETSENQATKADLKHLDIDFVLIPEFPSVIEFSKCIYQCLKTNQVDIVHSHGFTSGICSLLPTKFVRTPHLMTIHDVFTKNQFKGVSGIFKKHFLTYMFRQINLIHCVSFDAKENLLDYLPSLKNIENQIIVIPNGIESERFLIDDRKNYRIEHKLENSTFIIGFFGRFMSQKGFRFLVQAIEILKKRSLPKNVLVFCFGWGGFIREEQNDLKQKGLTDFFIFLPFIDNIATALRGLDVVVMPSLWEACGLLAMESMVAGTPLIASDCVGLREVTKNSPTRIVPSGNANALADEIEKEMLNPSKEISERFRKTAALKFDVENQVIQLRRLIRTLCK